MMLPYPENKTEKLASSIIVDWYYSNTGEQEKIYRFSLIYKLVSKMVDVSSILSGIAR